MLTSGDHPATRQISQKIRPLLIATGVSVSGDGALNTAAPLLAAALTSDPAAVAAVTAAVYVPWIVLGLPAGALVDRWPKRQVMVYADLFQAAVLGLFCTLTIVKWSTVPAVVITVALVNAAQCFSSPASQSAIPAVVGRDEEDLRYANGRYSSVDVVGRAMLGPLGGAWAFTVGRIIPFLADGVSFVVSAAFLRTLPPIPPSPGPHEPVRTAVVTGFRHLFRSSELVVLTLSTAAYNLGYFAAIAPFALYTRDVLHVGDVAFGALFAVLATAAVVTGWVGTKLVRGISVLRIRVITLLAPGLAWLVAAAIPNFWVTVVLFAVIGATAMIGSVTINAATQRLAPEGSIGRITSIVRLFAYGTAGLGSLVGGGIATRWGLSAPLVAAGAISVAAGFAIWVVSAGRDWSSSLRSSVK